MNLLSEKVDLNMNKYIIYNNKLTEKLSSRGNSNNNSTSTSPIKNYNSVNTINDNSNSKIMGYDAYAYSLNSPKHNIQKLNEIHKNNSDSKLNNYYPENSKFDPLQYNSNSFIQNLQKFNWMFFFVFFIKIKFY